MLLDFSQVNPEVSLCQVVLRFTSRICLQLSCEDDSIAFDLRSFLKLCSTMSDQVDTEQLWSTLKIKTSAASTVIWILNANIILNQTEESFLLNSKTRSAVIIVQMPLRHQNLKNKSYLPCLNISLQCFCMGMCSQKCWNIA